MEAVAFLPAGTVETVHEAEPRANVELRVAASGEPVVVFAFPYSAERVAAMRAIPGRRFDWDAREWRVPRHETTAVYVADVLARWPDLVADEAVLAWLEACDLRWLGRVSTRKRDGAGQFVVRTTAGELPSSLAALGLIAGNAWAQHIVPSALLTIDQNRATVIERIVGEWGDGEPV